MNVQVGVVREAGDRYFVVAGQIETKFARAEIGAGLCPVIQDSPIVPVLDLVDDLRRAHADLKHPKAFLVAFIGNFDLIRFLPVANDRAGKVVIVHLEENVVF